MSDLSIEDRIIVIQSDPTAEEEMSDDGYIEINNLEEVSYHPRVWLPLKL